MTAALSDLSHLRLMQLVSPTLPIGAFTYSQGLEWAVEAGWITSEDELHDWLISQARDTLLSLDIPLLKRLMQSYSQTDIEAFTYWSEYLVASRETRELRQEEHQRGRALTRLLKSFDLPLAKEWEPVLKTNQAAGFSLAACAWGIPVQQAALGYAWGWLENQVAAGIKLVPLGQTSGQQLQLRLASEIPLIIEESLQLDDESLGASSPSLAIASALHEQQYTRLFRS